MKKMNLPLIGGLMILSLVACPLMYLNAGQGLDESQLEVLRLLATIAGCSALYCFVVGELARNNSQVDKIWSILPFVYCWIIAVKGGMQPRLVVMAVLATLWGIRLTYNFARKGAYSIKFWEGEEDYRWQVVRSNSILSNRWVWMLFDLVFICFYQNVILLLITLPALASMTSPVPFGWIDAVAAVLMAGFILYETIADEQQWAFQTKKWSMIKSGQRLEELPAPYNKGFNTLGLWSVSRHPNYLAEQSIWVCLYLFSVGAGVGVLNWSMAGALLLIVLFIGSSNLAEEISAGKYPEYAAYCRQVSRFFPGRRYQNSKGL